MMHRSSYVRPHRHFTKSETLTVLDGAVTTLLFDTGGAVTTRQRMSTYESGCAFFYRMPPGIFHTIHFETEWFVYLETTTGPFNPADTEAAPWAPPETDVAAGHAYLATLL